MANESDNFFIPEILEEAVPGAFAGRKALLGSGAAIVKPGLPMGSRPGGNKVVVPYLDTIGELEDLVHENDALSSSELTMSSEEAEVQHSGKKFSIGEYAQMVAEYADPYGAAATQIADAVMRRADKALIDVATASGLPSEMVKNVWSSGTPRSLDYDLMVDAKMAWGDEQDDLALIVMHSKVLGDLYKIKETTGKPILTGMEGGDIVRFAGVPVKVSDRMPVDTTNPSHPKYTTALVKKGALVFWYAKKPRILEDHDIDTDRREMAVHVYWAAHRYGRLPGVTRGGVVLIKHNAGEGSV